MPAGSRPLAADSDMDGEVMVRLDDHVVAEVLIGGADDDVLHEGGFELCDRAGHVVGERDRWRHLAQRSTGEA